MSLLSVQNLEVSYGAIKAVRNISFQVNKGEIVALIGANGAGKSTILATITGLIREVKGSIQYNERELIKMPSHKIVSLGIAHVPEGRKIFSELSVYENLRMGAYTLKTNRNGNELLTRVYQRFPILKGRKKQLAGTLSGGEQQMLAIGRALMSDPQIILLDEPSMGLSPIFVSEIFSIMKQINKEGTTILLVEQNARRALELSDRAYVVGTGNLVLEGKSEDIMNNPMVRKAYLGES